MRKITLIIIHCSAVDPSQQRSASDIDKWHIARGWKHGIGYHYVIRRDGTIETGRPLEKIGAHCSGHNKHSIGICYEGGIDSLGLPADTRTPKQIRAMRELLEKLHIRFPEAKIAGHNFFNPMKACPCFDAISEYSDLQP